MKRVLVTGATGCVGRHALPLLVAARLGRARGRRRGRRRPTSPASRWHRAESARSRRDARRVVDARARQPPAAPGVVHRAGQVGGGAGELRRGSRASLELVRAFRAARRRARGHRRGSCLEYDWNYGYCSEDADAAARRTPLYGTCKHALQLLTSAHAGDGDLERVGPDLLPVRPARASRSARRVGDPLAPRRRAGAHVARPADSRLSLRRRRRRRVRARCSRATSPARSTSRRARPSRSRTSSSASASSWAGPDLIRPRRHSRRADRHAARRRRHDAAAERASAGSRAWTSTPASTTTIDWWRAQAHADGGWRPRREHAALFDRDPDVPARRLSSPSASRACARSTTRRTRSKSSSSTTAAPQNTRDAALPVHRIGCTIRYLVNVAQPRLRLLGQPRHRREHGRSRSCCSTTMRGRCRIC